MSEPRTTPAKTKVCIDCHEAKSVEAFYRIHKGEDVDASGAIRGVACPTIMGFREAHERRRELKARGFDVTRMKIVRVGGTAR